jgi:hypothetical protein
MGIKINLFVMIFVTFAWSCRTAKTNRGNEFFVQKDDFIKAYKTAFVCGCLNQGTSGNFYKFLKENNDLGLFTEADLISNFTVAEADSLGRAYSSHIKPFDYGDGKGMVPNFSRCLFFALSHQIDSISRARYKILMRNSRKN